MPKVGKKNAREIEAKARKLLAFARTRAKEARDWIELHNALFGIGGKATELFPTDTQRTAFSRMPECKQVHALMDTLPDPPAKVLRDLLATAHGAISIRLPRSLHAALLAEAEAEGVSLNQLCVSKLAVQLRASVHGPATRAG
jgi:hypothetical protein